MEHIAATLKTDSELNRVETHLVPRRANLAGFAVVESCCGAICERLLRQRPSRARAWVVGFTGDRRAAGVSTVAANVALAAGRVAEDDVLLLEANGRRPALAEALAIAPTPGFSEFSSMNADLTDCVHHSRYEHLDIMPMGDCGDAPTPPASLENRFATLRKQYDLIVVDLPALDDLAWPKLTRAVDGIVVVVDGDMLAMDALQRTARQLKQLEVALLGAVLNKVTNS